MRAPRSLKITREGRYYLIFTIGIGLAATNTGNNLLFLVLGMMLGLIVVSGLLSEAALRKLEVERMLPASAREGDPALVGVTLRNGNRALPSIGIEIEEISAEGFDGASGRCLEIAPGATARAEYRVTPWRRGELELIGVRVTTRYPFGLFAKSRRYDMPATVLVWPGRVGPGVERATEGREEAGPPLPHAMGVEDLRGLRRYRMGDEPRLVHWRRSLRVGKALVVERDAPEGRRVHLTLRQGEGAAFEDEVRSTAAIAEKHLQRGDEVSMDAPEGFSVPPGRGSGHRRRLLNALALVPPASLGRAVPRSVAESVAATALDRGRGAKTLGRPAPGVPERGAG